MGLATSFVNGNTVVPQAAGGGAITSPGPLLQVDGVPWSDVVGLPRGWGRAYRGKRGEHVWFHASVPTPVREDGAQVLVQDVFSLFWADAPCFMSDLHVWDGPDFLQAFDQLHTTGDQSHNVDRGVNAFQPRPNGVMHPMRWGVGISMLFDFSAGEATVTFASAGASFVYGQSS